MIPPAKHGTLLDLHFVEGKTFKKVMADSSLHQVIKSGGNR